MSLHDVLMIAWISPLLVVAMLLLFAFSYVSSEESYSQVVLGLFRSMKRRDLFIVSFIWLVLILFMLLVPGVKIRWQYDDVRAANAIFLKSEAADEKFNAAHTNKGVLTFGNHYTEFKGPTNEIEIGFVADGSLKWRYIPEQQPGFKK